MIINKKSKKLNIKKITKIIIPILAVFLLVILISNNVKRVKQKQEEVRIKSYTSIDDFKTIGEVAIYMDCEYQKQESSKTEGYLVDIYLNMKVPPFANNISNKQYYEQVIAYSAKVLQYENFIIIDDRNNLVISVICDKENNVINSYNINGDEQYFQTVASQIALEQFIDIKEIEYTINSQELLQTINNNWNTKDLIYGTKDGVFRLYNIFFEEGIEVRNINGKVFNIVFNSKYEKEVINGLKTTSTKQEIIEKLGTPQIEQNEIIGYKTPQCYIFFSNNEISIYRKEENYNTLEFAKLVQKYNEDKDLIYFIENVKTLWPDYDMYKYDSNYVMLQYSLKGMCIKYNYDLENGVFIYNNYDGYLAEEITYNEVINKQKEIPKQIYLKSENSLLVAEQQRIYEKNKIRHDVSNIILGKSNSFIIDIVVISNGTYEVSFISRDSENLNRNLKEYINYGVWLDDENFIYSVSYKGIYKYNVKNNTYTTLTKGNQEFKIINLKNGVLEYDDKTIKI